MQPCLLLLLLPLLALLSPARALRLVPQMSDGSGVLIAEVNGTEGGVCPDGFSLLEATVACRQLGLGWGRFLRPAEFDSELIPSERHVVRVSGCYGNETSLEKCRYRSLSVGVPCATKQAMGVRCTLSLPDLEPSVEVTERTSYVMEAPLFTVECAMEENCLAPSAAHMFRDSTPLARLEHKRILLRFSSIIRNKGTAPFLPLLEKHDWTFHSCHRHYHSMPDFARYAVIDKAGTKVAVGHKSSFCLEDSECHGGVKKYFRCSRIPKVYGTQGISPGCQDTYFHDYDCQWVDITDLDYGRYTFQMVINPRFAVAEIDFANNGIECAFIHNYWESALRGCHRKHPRQLQI